MRYFLLKLFSAVEASACRPQRRPFRHSASASFPLLPPRTKQPRTSWQTRGFALAVASSVRLEAAADEPLVTPSLLRALPLLPSPARCAPATSFDAPSFSGAIRHPAGASPLRAVPPLPPGFAAAPTWACAQRFLWASAHCPRCTDYGRYRRTRRVWHAPTGLWLATVELVPRGLRSALIRSISSHDEMSRIVVYFFFGKS